MQDLLLPNNIKALHNILYKVYTGKPVFTKYILTQRLL